MVAPDELLPILERILPLIERDSSVLEGWSKTEDGQKVVQFIQIGKYNTNLGRGEDISIGDGLDKKLLEEIRDLLRLQQSTPLPNIDWQTVSRSRLNEQIQRLTTNPLTHAEGITYRTEQVYVPLGLVERKRQARRREDVPPEQGSLLYEETEITQKFEHEAFLEQVLREGHSPRSGGRRIAVIGEPGAGKTTLLQQIARWVSENIEGSIVVWVSLADLQGQELEDYLLERWLPAGVQQVGQAEASTQVKDAFVAQVQQGRGWLLLDGVDEMQVSSGNPLSEIERQVRLGGLLSQARIVLTCRLNLWDGNRHALDTFDTYRTLEFSYPVQVEQFAGQWFEALPDAQAGQAERLCAALKAPGKERIRDLVKNPLRLTLLCFNWYLGEGTLPETKAGLYEQFVADFYEWKRERFPTTGEQRQRLNAALGELAREAIDKEETRFRLRHDFVCKFLGDPDEPDSLFQMALRLGWLNRVGVDAENRRKAVYAFFHPTFQEYLAALAIDSWHYFLNHNSKNPNHSDASYRVFESLWKEVILLWFGRGNVDKEEKEISIKQLIDFKDDCGNFYWHQAYLIAGFISSEFEGCRLTNEILEQLAKFSFGCFDEKNQKWKNLSRPIVEASKTAIKGSDLTKAVDILVREIYISQNEGNHQRVIDIAQTLGQIDPDNSVATFNLFKLSDKEQPVENRYRAARILGEIKPDSLDAMETLIHIIKNNQDKDKEIFWQAIASLEKISYRNSEVIDALAGILKDNKDNYVQCQTARILGKIDPGNQLAVQTIIELLQTCQDDEIRYIAFRVAWEIAGGHPDIIKVLESLTKKYQTEELLEQVSWTLLKINPGNKNAVEILRELLCTSKDGEIRRRAATSIGIIFPRDPDAINELSNQLCQRKDINEKAVCAWFLEKIDPGNFNAIQTLIGVLQNSNDSWTLERASGVLEDIPGSFLTLLVSELRHYSQQNIIENSFNRHIFCYEVLWNCSKKMSYPDFFNSWRN